MQVLSQLLPQRPIPTWVRYAATAVIVLVFGGLRAGLPIQDSPFLLFVPAVFISSLLFGRGCGFFATALSALFAMYLILPASRELAVGPSYFVSLVIFLLLCVGISAVNHALRGALKHLTEAEAQASLMLEELGHRIRNNLHVIMSVLTLQARTHRDPTLQQAIDAAVNRIRVIANAHEHLQRARKGEAVDMREYLEGLCNNLVESVRGVKPVAIRVESDAFTLPTESAVPIGLIVNELVTNAFKYAFPDEQEGLIVVALRRGEDARLMLTVSDNGAGCPESVREGLGSRLVRMLVQQLNGSLARQAGVPKGCQVKAEFHLPSGTPEPSHAAADPRWESAGAMTVAGSAAMSAPQ
jgi:two-component sensor histidine kinase